MILKSKPIKKTREKSENFCKQTDLLTHNKFLIPQQQQQQQQEWSELKLKLMDFFLFIYICFVCECVFVYW